MKATKKFLNKIKCVYQDGVPNFDKYDIDMSISLFFKYYEEEKNCSVCVREEIGEEEYVFGNEA